MEARENKSGCTLAALYVHIIIRVITVFIIIVMANRYKCNIYE